MHNHKIEAVLIKETKNFKRYKLGGDCLGTVYVPKEIKEQVIEVELSPRLKEGIQEQ